MLKLKLSQAAAKQYSRQAYRVIYTGAKQPSDPLTKGLGDVDPDDLNTWFTGKGGTEEIGLRHHCGFYIFITLSATVDKVALRELYFDAAYSHSLDGLMSRPDKAVIYTAFDAGHLAFAKVEERSIFKLTPIGQSCYLEWLHTLMPRRFPDFPILSSQ
ncbi:hypothetical protein [Kordiimonas sp.]|uniref:hypothetical protein n=1 Tax=Kordiimonas sp. TaxID=1970157 RepID=UPI003A912143